VRLLLIEILRRHKPLQLLGVAMLAGVWYIVGGEDASAVSAALGASLCAVFLIGPGRISMMVPPAVSYLPLSRRDIWRATWLASTVWPTALATATMLLMMLVPATRTTMGFSRVTLSAAYDFAYTGAGCVMVILLAAAGSHPRIWRPLRDVLIAIVPLASMSGFYVAFWGRRFLSTQWSELSPSGASVLISTIGLVTAMYFYSPPVTGTPPLRAGSRRSATERAALPVPSSRLTGLPKLLWNEYTWTLGIAAVIVSLVAVIVVVLDTFFNTQHLAAGVVRAQLVRLFDRQATTSEFGFGYIFWLALFIVAGVGRFGFMIRHLRVLPMRPLQLNTMLVVWPAGVLVPVWAALMVAYLLVSQQPVTRLSLGVLLSLIGLSALARSITMRWQPMFMALVVVVAFMGVLSGIPLSGPPAPVLAVTGIAGLIAAALLNRDTLRRSATYRRPAMAIGLAPPR
jgi:hypothetical protein